MKYDELANEEDASTATKIQRIKEGEQRLTCAYRFSISLGFTAEQAAEAEEAGVDGYSRRVTELLSSCDQCVRNYHMGRKEFLGYIAE